MFEALYTYLHTFLCFDQAMDNCETLRPILQIHDRPILKKLKDIKVITSPLYMTKGEKSNSGNMGFRLEFHFAPNEYFENEILHKVRQ